MKKVLFVCTGNTCRSPMAEALFNSMADKSAFVASSCGIYGDGVSPIGHNAKAALLEKGIEFSHTSTPVSEKLIEDADLIVGMAKDHTSMLLSMFPQYADKFFAMPHDISDPYGGDVGVYRKCRDEISECITSIIGILSEENNG